MARLSPCVVPSVDLYFCTTHDYHSGGSSIGVNQNMTEKRTSCLNIVKRYFPIKTVKKMFGSTNIDLHRPYFNEFTSQFSKF